MAKESIIIEENRVLFGNTTVSVPKLGIKTEISVTFELPEFCWQCDKRSFASLNNNRLIRQQFLPITIRVRQRGIELDFSLISNKVFNSERKISDGDRRYNKAQTCNTNTTKTIYTSITSIFLFNDSAAKRILN